MEEEKNTSDSVLSENGLPSIDFSPPDLEHAGNPENETNVNSENEPSTEYSCLETCAKIFIYYFFVPFSHKPL